MARAVELLVCRAHVAPQAPEEGRKDLLFIARSRINQLTHEERLLHRIVVDDAHAAADPFVGHVAPALDEDEDRNAESITLNAVELAVLRVLDGHQNDAGLRHLRFGEPYNLTILGKVLEGNIVTHCNCKLLHVLKSFGKNGALQIKR